MDQHLNINLHSGEDPHQHVYILQLDPNVQIESQAIPLHILESDLDGDLILPLLQQKQSQSLPQLLIEPLKEPNEIANKYLKAQDHNKIDPNGQIDSAIPVTSVINITNESNHVQSSAISKRVYALTSSPSINKKFEAPENNESQTKYFEIEVKTEKIRPPKLKLNYVHISDTKVPPRAIAVLPHVLQIKGKWISPRKTLSPHIRFGPVQGIQRIITRSEAKTLVSNMESPVFLLHKDEDYVIHIDVSDTDKSNWIGLLPLGNMATATTAASANLWLYEEGKELYALTMQPINARIPLRLGYSEKYVQDHQIPPGPPVLDLDLVNSVQWWCSDCNRALGSSALLKRHNDVYHKDYIKSRWSSYRCKYCKRAFSRMFTLKRHTLTNCLKRPQKSPDKSQQSTESKLEPEIKCALEDTRIPSDESFQNFANSLDFSTNLFDTDRMSGLDISGNSRADSEMNPYCIGFRDENGLSNDLGFTKLTNAPETIQNKTNEDKLETILETCSYCSQVVVKENKSSHFRQCPSRLICECGRVFRHKQSLAKHINKWHPSEKLVKPEKTKQDKTQNQKKLEQDKNMPYKCQECPLGFKRRGVLVNHLWRIHKLISTMPVEKKVRHYPCVVCTKIYRSATKRNKHVRVHHPGAEKLRGQSIEGGVKSCQPASCTECPRQYATRAKLLQHVRSHHPLLAKTIQNQAIKKKEKLKTDIVWMDDAEDGLIPRDFNEYDFAEDALDFENQLAESRDVKFVHILTEPLSIGSHIVCTGTPSEDLPWFAVNIGCGDAESGRGDLALHFNVRMPQCYVVRNTKRHDKWGIEETTAYRSFPFKVGRLFTIEVLVDEKETLWAVDGEHYASYAHRNPSVLIANWVQVTGIRDAALKVQKTDIYPTLAPRVDEVPLRPSIDSLAEGEEPSWRPNVTSMLTNGVPEGHQLVIYGRLRPLLHSFVIDLMDGAREWPRPNLPLHTNVRAHVESQRDRQLVVLNSWLGEWGLERRQRTAKLIPGTYATFRLVRSAAEWALYADDILIGELEYRASPEGIKSVRIRGDLYPEQIYLCPASTSPIREYS